MSFGIVFAVTLGVTALTVPITMRIARRVGAIAVPGDRRVHATPTPTLGGAAMLPAFLASSERLIEAGRSFPEVSPEEAARMWGRLTRATATGGAAGALPLLAALTPRQIVLAIALAGGAGLFGGAAAMAALHLGGDPAANSATTVSAPLMETTAAPPTASADAVRGDPVGAVVEAPRATASSPVAGVGKRAVQEPESSSRAERALLDHARASLQRGDPVAALRELAKHAQQFPDGIHADERESMRGQAAALLQRDAAPR